MRILKLSLIALLVLVSVLFGLTKLDARMSGRDIGPKIEGDGQVLEVSVRDPEQILLTGLTASDRQDGDLTQKIQILSTSKLITGDTARVTYLVFDSDGNMATHTRQIRYTDYHRPVYSVDQPLIYAKNEPIALLDRLTATDVLDGDITENIRVSTLSATSDSEIWTVSLQVTNSMGDTARITLPVILLEGTAVRPKIHLTEQLLYLEQGASFRAENHIRSVSLPSGQGSLTDVQITGEVDTQDPGTYMVYYRYPHNGTMGIAILTVVVQ